MNIYLGLALPINVRINYNLVPRLPSNRIARNREVYEAKREVIRALVAWRYGGLR